MLDALGARRMILAELRIEHVAGPREALLWFRPGGNRQGQGRLEGGTKPSI